MGDTRGGGNGQGGGRGAEVHAKTQRINYAKGAKKEFKRGKGFYNLLTTLWIPSFKSELLKLINKPNFKSVSFK